MNKILSTLVLSLGICGLQAQDSGQEAKVTDTLSYSVGMMQAMDLMSKGMSEVDIEQYLAGFSAAINEKAVAIDADQARILVRNHLEKQKELVNQMSKEKGVQFLAENAKREEVVQLPSGLQYEILVEGDGPIPEAKNKVTTHYTGMLIDGTVFDSSVQRGEPISFPVGGVIQGWQEALQLMPQGSKWKLYIPENLAYGARGAGGVIPPFATLIFEIELLDIQ